MHRAARGDALGRVGQREDAALAELRRVERRDRQVFSEESQEVVHGEPVGVLRAAGAIGEADDAHVGAVVTVEDLEHVARDVAVGAALFDRPRLRLLDVDHLSASRRKTATPSDVPPPCG